MNMTFLITYDLCTTVPYPNLNFVLVSIRYTKLKFVEGLELFKNVNDMHITDMKTTAC